MTFTRLLPKVDELPWANAEYFGIRVSYIGEDGDMIALGHHDDRRVIAAMNRHARLDIKLANMVDEPRITYAEVLKTLTRRWAVVLGECGDCIDPADGMCERCECARDGSHWISCDALETEPNAYPVTYWEA